MTAKVWKQWSERAGFYHLHCDSCGWCSEGDAQTSAKANRMLATHAGLTHNDMAAIARYAQMP